MQALQEHSKIQTFIHAKLSTERELLLCQRSTNTALDPFQLASKDGLGANAAFNAGLGAEPKTKEEEERGAGPSALAVSSPRLAPPPLFMRSAIAPEDFGDSTRANVPLPDFNMVCI